MQSNGIHKNVALSPTATGQIDACLDLVKEIFERNLLGVYLYGSAISGGLHKYSDIDLFVVTDRATTPDEKKLLMNALLNISGVYMNGDKFPIEMTIVEKSEINP